MFLKPNIIKRLIKSAAWQLTLPFLVCFCFSSQADNISASEKQAIIFQASSPVTTDIINVFNPGVPAIAVKTKSIQNSGQHFQNKSIFKSISFSDRSGKASFNYLENQIRSQRLFSLRLHLALRVLLI